MQPDKYGLSQAVMLRQRQPCGMQAIATATSESFSALRRKLGARGRNGVPSAEKPFFDVAVELSIPNVNINPPLEAIQGAITTTAKQVPSGRPYCVLVPDARGLDTVHNAVNTCSTVVLLRMLRLPSGFVQHNLS